MSKRRSRDKWNAVILAAIMAGMVFGYVCGRHHATRAAAAIQEGV